MQVPVYRQQRPEDSKIGTQSAAKSGRPEQQRKHHGATAKQQGGAIQGGRGDGVTVGQTLSAGSVGAASQWRHLRAGWAPPPVSPCASLCSLCCSAVAREAGAGRPVRPRHRVACERRGVFLSDAAERGRGATFDNAPFQIRRKPSKGRRPRPRGAALVLRAVLRHGRASKRVLLVSVFVFARFAREDHTPLGWFVLRHVVYSAAPITPSSPWLRVDATLLSLQIFTASGKTRPRTH